MKKRSEFFKKEQPLQSLEVISEQYSGKDQVIFTIRDDGALYEYSYKCICCGECCRGNFEIHIRREDVRSWMELGKEEMADSIRLRPECIAMRDKHGVHIKTGKALKWIIKEHGEERFSKKLEELRQFIERSHHYFGEDKRRPEVYSIFKNMRRTPILVPRDLETVLKGKNRGLQYVIYTDAYGVCPFLQLNKCIIQEYKPIACKCFPHDRKGHLRVDNYRLKKCQGFKLIGEITGKPLND